MGSYEHVWTRIGVMDKNKSGIHGQLKRTIYEDSFELVQEKDYGGPGKRKIGI